MTMTVFSLRTSDMLTNLFCAIMFDIKADLIHRLSHLILHAAVRDSEKHVVVSVQQIQQCITTDKIVQTTTLCGSPTVLCGEKYPLF